MASTRRVHSTKQTREKSARGIDNLQHVKTQPLCYMRHEIQELTELWKWNEESVGFAKKPITVRIIHEENKNEIEVAPSMQTCPLYLEECQPDAQWLEHN